MTKLAINNALIYCLEKSASCFSRLNSFIQETHRQFLPASFLWLLVVLSNLRMQSNGQRSRQELEMSGVRQARTTSFIKLKVVLIMVLSFLCQSCCSEVQVYRYVDDADNLISNDDYYASLPPSSIYSSFEPTKFRPSHPPPTQPNTRYPVYIRPTLLPPPSPPPPRRPDPTIPPPPVEITTSIQTVEPPQHPPTPTSVGSASQEEDTSSSPSDLEGGNSVRVERPVSEVFLTKGNTEETILPLGLSGEGSAIRDIVISQVMVRNESEFNHVVLLCNASYPVEWSYQGVGAPTLYTTQIRTFGNFFDPLTYGHSSIVVLVQGRLDERQTGTYICKGIDPSTEELRTGFHLYFKGEFGFPSLQNVVIQPPDNDSTVMLPCPTTHPAATIGLYKVTSSKESRNLKLRGSFAYDPRNGFSVKLSDMSNPFGTYICKFNDIESNWKIQVVPPKYEEVQVIPNGTVIQMDNLANHSFMCRAKEPIQLMLPNTVDFGRVEYFENFEHEFPFLAKLTITPNIPLFSVANYFKVNCQSRKTRRVLHTWEYSNFGSEVISVTYDKDHKRLLCCSKSGLTPRHEMAKCETFTDCNIKKHCFQSGRCDYAFPPPFVDAPRGCTAIEFMDDFPSHVMRCSVGQFSQTMFVTSNIANDNLLIYDGGVPSTEEILKISHAKSPKHHRVHVRCVASIFYFSTNIVFAFEHADGTLTFADEGLIENVHSYGPTLVSVVPPDTKRVICFAPLTRSSEWRNATLDIEFAGEKGRSALPATTSQTSGDDREQVRSPLQLGGEEGEAEDPQRIVTSVKASTSVTTFLRKRQGHLIRVMQDV